MTLPTIDDLIDEPFTMWNHQGCWYGRQVSLDGAEVTNFTSEDVECVIAVGSPTTWNEQQAAVLRLKNGVYVSWETFIDVTGSGFHGDAYGGDSDIYYANNLALLIRMGLTDDSREWLGFDKVTYQ